MLSVWEVKMRAVLCLLLAASCVLADKNDNRRTKLPFVADAVGNSLPPPSKVPATVGSPVNLLTPDRYEFYTFDESGELVKRLMTLEEIQAIVAAGEEAEGLVTFANDNQPTVSFNMNQPPYTKVHSVVTNVQNVLKAQMEAHKNKPHFQPTLDTPDVSDSWSLILPSIFGNTGVDIVLDKASGSVTPPETDTLEEHVEDEENSLSKEGSNQVISSSTTLGEVVVTEKLPAVETEEEPSTTSTTTTTTTTSTTTTTTPRPTTTTRKPTTTTRKPTTTTRKPTTTTRKITTTTTTEKPTTTTVKATTTTTNAPTTTSTTKKPVTSTTTTKKPTTANFPTRLSSTASVPSTKTTASPRPSPTTVKPTTPKPVIKTTVKVTTAEPEVTTKKHSISILPEQEYENINVHIQPNANAVSSTEKNEIEFEKISTFIPVSAVNYINERTTRKPVVTSQSSAVYASTTKRSVPTTTHALTSEPPKIQTFATTSNPVFSTSNYISSTLKEEDIDKINTTTITTQSVSPSTTMSSTEIVSANNLNTMDDKPADNDNDEKEKDPEPLLPLFDVAQSISQIASDLGGSYQPIPTTSNLLDTTNLNGLGLESKEVLDMDIPSGSGNETDIKTPEATDKNTDIKTPEATDKNTDNFVKISTIDPHGQNENKENSQTKNDNILKETGSIKTETKETEVQKTEIKETEVQKTDTKESEKTQALNESKNPNIIIKDVQKVEVFTTPAATEATTIDPILSESMGDLLSQVVNEAPQSIVEQNPEKEVKPTTTEKNVELTTVESVHISEITSEISNKVKKETSSTTESSANSPKEEVQTKDNDISNKINLLSENNKNKTIEVEEKIQIQTLTKPTESKKDENKKGEELEDNTKNFVQISVSTNNKNKVEPVSTENKNNIEKATENQNNVEKSTEKNTEVQKESAETKREKEMTKNGNKTTETVSDNVSSAETKPEKEMTKNGNKTTETVSDNVSSAETKPEKEMTKNGNKTTETVSDNVSSVETKPEKEMTKNGNKTTETVSVNVSSAETTTTSSDLITTTTTTPQKISQSKFNKINLPGKININNKKDKLPEPLPKVDDFKKKIQKVNIDEEELVNERNNSWKLIPTLSPPKANEIPKDKVKSENHYVPDNENKDIVLEFSNENQGLEVTTKDLGEDLARFSELSNELAFRFWNVMIDDIDKNRSFVLSPYSIFSMLAMIFMGARGATSGEMNEILKLDDMVTFNPHFTLKNISDSIETTPESGVAVSAFIRELYSDRNKGKILTFYKERTQHFYNGHVEEVNFKLISDIIRRRTNLLVKRYTWGKIPEYMKTNNIVMQPPLAAFTANIFETDCSGTSVEGRDGEMYFVVSPNVRQRRLVPVPAVVYKSGFLAGYDPVLDATAAALGNTNTIVSTLFLMPGQQGNVVHADDLEKLEERLLDALPTTPTWNRVLRTLLPRTGLELQIPRFAQKSTFNVSMSLRKMGLKDLFDGDHADLGGLNGPSKDLYLSDMVQLNTFATCGEDGIGEQHHSEEYPETLSVSQRRRTRWLNDWDEPRDYQRAFHDPHDVGDAMHLPLHLRPRQARLPARSALPARLKFDRPFLYFVRHNPSGIILYFGRYNPRLLP